MPSPTEPGYVPSAPRSLGKGRMEAFSDGVIAIAITLLVLELAIHPPGSALDQVLHIWPAYLAYVISFLTIGAAWLVHTSLTDRLARVDSVFLRLNLLFLLFVTFLPFPTGLVGEALRDREDERVFITIYGLTLLAIRLLSFALDEYSAREHLQVAGGEEAERRDRRQFLRVVSAYVIGIVLGLVLPVLAVVMYLVIGLYLVVPFREIARLLSPSH
jgi:uncharacterized membrane protein